MLPKVATQILHQSTRAVATSTHSLRTHVLSTTKTNPGSGGSGSGSGGPGPKYHPGGSRFYSGYTGAGRAVTQANGVSTVNTNDEGEDSRPRRLVTASVVVPKVRLLTRRQSTLATIPHSMPPNILDMPPAMPSPAVRSAVHHALLTAASSGSSTSTAEAVMHFRSTTPHPSLNEFNAALSALHSTRVPGESLALLMETYNDMLARSILPNINTYIILISALTDRDNELHKIHTSLSVRQKRIDTLTVKEKATLTTDLTNFQQTQAENNFSTAMSLFDAILAINGNKHLPVELYANLIRSASFHGSVPSAIHVFASLEQRTDIFPSPSLFTHLLSLYATANDLVGLRTIFAEFNRACAAGEISWSTPAAEDIATAETWTKYKRLNALLHIQVYNKMISSLFRLSSTEEALELLEKMISSPEVPKPASSTYTAVIAGFVHNQDLDMAVAWFDRLLLQKTVAKSPYESYEDATRPDTVAWGVMIDALASSPAHVHDLNRLWSVYIKEGLPVRISDRVLVQNANDRYFKEVVIPVINGATMPEGFSTVEEVRGKAIEMVTFMNEQVLLKPSENHFLKGVLQQYLTLGGFDGIRPAMSAVMAFMQHDRLHGNLVKSAASLISQRFRETVPLDMYLLLHWLLRHHAPGDALEQEIGSYAIKSFMREQKVKDFMTDTDWETLLSFACKDSTDATVAVLSAMQKRDIPKEFFTQRSSLFDTVRDALGDSDNAYGDIFTAPAATEPSEISGSELEVSTAPTSPLLRKVNINSYHSRYVDEFFHAPGRPDPIKGYSRLLEGIQFDKFPTPHVLGHLITSLGRVKELEKLESVYNVAQDVLEGIQGDWQAQAWLCIEDAMVVGLAHAGFVDRAHVHRVRILEFSPTTAPSADAYGVLIQFVRDTSDDTTGSLALFHEAKSRNVTPNVFLYNNIISKLAKARKADAALELFAEMKNVGCTPSPITYGALVGACARVGDVQSAEVLFEEMTRQRNFKPRIPPYNTMMQLYTSTKPDREKVIEYFGKMENVGVVPSEFTYKLLLDAYGTIEPIDLDGVQATLARLQADPYVKMDSTHHASLIHIHGCVLKDLDYAQQLFSSIPTPDALIYESIINVSVTHRRGDLISFYTDRMTSVDNVQMTAYIANFLIRGYALLGDLEKAREVFGGMEDAQVGMASAGMEQGTQTVYREPSTWEVMIRAELGAGNRENAVELIERLRQRNFPEAVYNRIKGIMLDDSVSPWPAAAPPATVF